MNTMSNLDFKAYDDVMDVRGYDGFIDKFGNFYKVGLKSKKGYNDTHNEWAEQFIKEKLCIKEFKFNPTTSALFTLAKLRGPAEILVNCFGYVYYSHDPIYYNPIIKLPNPKIANLRATEEQYNTLFSIMLLHNENTNIPVLFDEEIYSHPDDSNVDGYQYIKK